jgi:hypothetical protein
MAIKLNKAGFERAKKVITNGLEIIHQSNWEAEKPTDNDKDLFIETHTLNEYGEWFLGINTDAGTEDLSRYVYPWGDFKVLHVSALKSAEQKGTEEIKQAARSLFGMIKKK